MLTDYQQRVEDERHEVYVRLKNLLEFIDGILFSGLPVEERQRLTSQARIMREYYDVLADRIMAFPPPPPAFKVGDRVRITRAAVQGENGWDNAWTESMDETVGKIGIVTNVDSRIPRDINVQVPNITDTSWGYPDFVLELVKVNW